MDVHLIDGTYELFRHFYGQPSRLDTDGKEVGALLGVVVSIISMLKEVAFALVSMSRTEYKTRVHLWL